MFEVVSNKTHEAMWRWLEFCRACPVLGRNGVFGVFGCLRCYELVFLAWYIMLKLFEMFTSLGFNRCLSCGPFAEFLVFEAKGELTKAKVVEARLRPAESW